MKRATLKHILFTILTTVMCFGFSSYVVLSKTEVAKEVNVNINEEDAETAEKTVSEIGNFYLLEELYLHTAPNLVITQVFHHCDDQLPDFSLIPNTPPPNLA